jgi:hypothetical protein
MKEKGGGRKGWEGVGGGAQRGWMDGGGEEEGGGVQEGGSGGGREQSVCAVGVLAEMVIHVTCNQTYITIYTCLSSPKHGIQAEESAIAWHNLTTHPRQCVQESVHG